MATVHVLAATGRTGRLLTRRLAIDDHDVIAVARDADKLATLPGAAESRVADFLDHALLTQALADAQRIVSCAHAGFVPDIVECVPKTIERLVTLGSTRKFSRVPAPENDKVRAGEAAQYASGLPGVMLHPTMIYGAEGERNVARVVAALRRFRVIPLVKGGKTLLQPIHVDDVVDCLIAALFRDEALGESIVIAGPAPITYADFVRAIGASIGIRPIVVPVPVGLAKALATSTGQADTAEVERLLEDKDFDVGPMRERLGIIGREFAP
jgi:uncharacterized protein YbjT (DUF2867 family)